MARSAQEIFQLYKTQKYELFLKGVRGTYLFDIDQVGSWFVSVEDGAVTSDERRCDAECVIRCSEVDSIDIVKGRRNLLTAALQGPIQVRGESRWHRQFTDS